MSEMYFLQGHVYHARAETADNSFKYPILNIYFNTEKVKILKEIFKLKFLNLVQFRSQDYLSKKQDDISIEIKQFVKKNFNYDSEKVFLQTLPRMFGYVFNPVSFWYFYKDLTLDAVLCEVSNTFGEKHYYWLQQEGRDLNNQWLEAKKVFHVSPFFAIEGFYKFKFSITPTKVDATIQLLNDDSSIKLVTWIRGDLIKFSQLSLGQIILKYGWMTPLVVGRIHYQAAKLFLKKVQFFSKPNPPQQEISHESRFVRR